MFGMQLIPQCYEQRTCADRSVYLSHRQGTPSSWAGRLKNVHGPKALSCITTLMYHKRDISRQPPICLMFQLGPQEGPIISIKSVSTATWRRDRQHKHPRIPCGRVRQHQPDEPCTSDSARQWKTQKTIWKSFGSRDCDTHNYNRSSSYSSSASSPPSQPSLSVSSTVSKGFSGR